MSNSIKMILSIVKPPELELKSLLEHLKYEYLGAKNTLPIIIASGLSVVQEEAFLAVLKQQKRQ